MATIDVRVPHPSYKDAYHSIISARDCYLGERAVKARADFYLPRLSGQKMDEYYAYKMRATFYSIVGRTIGALTGLAIQGDVAVKGNEETTKQMKDNEHGMQLFEATLMAVSEILLQGRIGILIDSPMQSSTVGLYGYISDDIINWETDASGQYTMVVLHEQREVKDPTNPFKKDLEDQYRVLQLVGGVYTVTVYGKDGGEIIFAQQVPTFNGQPLNYIPFYTAMPDGVRSGVAKSPMEDMVAINLSHYRTSADLEHGRHFVGLPTPVITGAEVQGKMRIGGSQAWVLPDKDAKAYYLEFKGDGLKSLESALKEKEGQLSSLSSSIISRSVKGSESPDAIRMRMSSETASLYSVVKTVQTLLTKAYNIKSALEGNAEDIELIFPTQFVSGNLTADELEKMSKIYLSGGMTVTDYVNALRRGGALSASRTDDEVKSELLADAQKRAADALKAQQKQSH
jgi:hypothetical protein